MATITELVTDTAAATDALTITRDFSVTDTAAASDADTANKSAIATDTAAAADATAHNVSTNQAAADNAEASEAVELSVALAVEDTGAAADAAAFTVDSFVVDTAAASDGVSATRSLTQLVIDTAIASDAPVIHTVVEVEDTAAAADSMRVVLAVGIEDSADASTTEAPRRVTAEAAASTAEAVDACTFHVAATEQLTDTAVATAHAVMDPSDALWANSRTMAGAKWTGLPFNSYAMHEGALLAAGAGGLYAVGADDDAGNPIVARVRGDLTDLGSIQRKTLEAAYVAAIAAGTLRLKVATEDGEWSYDEPTQGARMANVYFELGRGLYSRYVRFELTNPDGAFFRVRDASVLAGATKRLR